jgi:hypothetical protein
MTSQPSIRMAFWALFALFVFAGVSSAQVLNHNEVEFTATVNSIVDNGSNTGKIEVDVSGTPLTVLVDAETDIESGEIEIALTDLKAGDVIKVEGKFSSEGVLASSIDKLTSGAENGFEVRGQITDIQVTTDVVISIAGIEVHADLLMKTSGRPGTTVDVAKLIVGTAVSIEGTVSGSTVSDITWNATSVHVFSDKGKKKKDVVRFEGTIVSMAEGTIEVKVEGTEIIQPVIIGPDTKVCGTLAVGAVVEVKGKLNAELKIEADVVCVLGALEIKPDELKLKVGEAAVLTVKLRETAASDVTVNLTVAPSGVITLSAVSVTVPQGSKAAEFSVTAGASLGEATITATIDGETATALVVVGEFSDSDNENPNAAVRIAFAPDHIKLGRNDARDVVLLVQPPQQRPVNVKLEIKGDLASADIHRDLSEDGAAVYKVTVKSKADAGAKSGSVIATLPDVVDSGTAELVVEITDKGK